MVVEDDDQDLDVWGTFITPRVDNYLPKSMPSGDAADIESVIARALFQKGVPIWSGIPTYIIEELDRAGLKIVKKGKTSGRRPSGVDK